MNAATLDADLEALRAAARALRVLPTVKKNAALRRLSALLEERESEILEANARDLAALPADATAAFRDRLTLDPKRLAAMRTSLDAVRALPDPVNEIVEEHILSSGIKARKARAPLGVLFLIFESRPNVAVEAFSLAFKAGNSLLLRGGKESKESVACLARLIGDALDSEGVPRAACLAVTDPDRALVDRLLARPDAIDVVIPRGSEKLIEAVVAKARMPVLKHDRGLCHLYVHEDADLRMAVNLLENGKTQRPGVCNALETLLVHEKVAPVFLARAYERLSIHGVKWHACPRSFDLLSTLPGAGSVVSRVDPRSYDTEYLDLELSCRVVGSLDEAIAHIEKHGSRHSEVIVTQDEKAARRFQCEVDAAAVYWNASSRFTDGFEMGLGGEMGISTQKLHVRGPVGLRELTSVRWILDGRGETRK